MSKYSTNIIPLIESFLELFPRAGYGPAHCVLDDYNIEDVHIKWVLNLIDAVLLKDNYRESGLSEEDLELVRMYLDRFDEEDEIYDPTNFQDELIATKHFMYVLLCIPEEVRDEIFDYMED